MATRREFLGQGGLALGGLVAMGQTNALNAAAAGNVATPALRRDEFDGYDALGLADLVRRGEVTAGALLERSISRAEAAQPLYNALAVKDYDYARASLDRLPTDGPFAGVPFLLKDLWVSLAGTVSTNGSRFFDGVRADYDGELIRRFQRAGLVIFGKTTAPELGLTGTTESVLHGLTRNPWNTSRVAGGSSGGAAVAVAAGLVPIAHASDGAGSIRTPASCCGLFGLKPSRGRVPQPIDALEGWNGLHTDFAISRSVRDAAAMLDAVAGRVPGSIHLEAPPAGVFLGATRRDPRPLRIALMHKPYTGSAVDAECLRAVERTATLCRELGHEVTEDAPELSFVAATAGLGATLMVHVAKAIEEREQVLGRACTPDDVEKVTWVLAEAGRKTGGIDYARAREDFDSVARRMAAFFERYDLLLTPTLGQPPVELGRLDLSPDDVERYVQEVQAFNPFCALANVAGQPAMTVPLHWSADGLPIGSMFQGRFGEEAQLLALAAQLERASPWRDRRPAQ